MTVVAPAALALAACAGSGADPTDSVRDLTGLAPPVETPAEQLAREPELLARSDSLLLSTFHIETDLPEAPAFRLLTECGGTQCTRTNSLTGASDTLAVSDLEVLDLPTEAVGAKHGMTLIWVAGQHMDTEITTLGACRAARARVGFSQSTEDCLATGPAPAGAEPRHGEMS